MSSDVQSLASYNFPDYIQRLCTWGAFHYAKDSGNSRWSQMERSVSVSSDPNIRDHPWRWSTYFGQEYSDRNSPFHFCQTGALP